MTYFSGLPPNITTCPLPSILDIFLARCSSKATSIVKYQYPSLPQSLPAPTIRNRSIRVRSARLLNSFPPPGCESPELNSHRPSLKSHTNPYLLKHGPSPPPPTPKPYHITYFFFLCAIRSVLVSGPVQSTCNNTLSCIHTRHFHTLL